MKTEDKGGLFSKYFKKNFFISKPNVSKKTSKGVIIDVFFL